MFSTFHIFLSLEHKYNIKKMKILDKKIMIGGPLVMVGHWIPEMLVGDGGWVAQAMGGGGSIDKFWIRQISQEMW